MKYSPEQLVTNERFEKILELSYSDILPFVFGYLKKRNLPMVFFYLFCILTLAVAVVSGLGMAGTYPWYYFVSGALSGLLLMPLLLVPLHEGIHGLAYFLSGARNIRYGADLSQYIFYVTAHQEVVGRGAFTLVALMPCLLITLLLLFLASRLPQYWSFMVSCCLFAHTTMCAGDFAMLSFLSVHQDKELYTFDDVVEKKAYFYAEKTGR